MTKVLSFLGANFIRALGRTIRIRKINSKPWYIKNGVPNVIYAFWHGEQFILCYTHSFHNIAIMSSLSKDGEIQAGVLKRLGFSVVRGSSSKGAERALVELIKLARKGHVSAFAVDGPKGPFHEIKHGVAFHAYKTGKPIIPLNAASKKYFTLFKAWDKYELPYPFTRSLVMYGKPINITRAEDIESKVNELKIQLDTNSVFVHGPAWTQDIKKYVSKHPYPNILVIQPSRIGDVIFSLPAINALRKKYPKAVIHWVVDERCAPILEGHPDIDKVIVFDRSKVSLSYLISFRKQLRSYNFDLSIDFHGLFKSAFVAWLAGAHFKIGSASTRGMKELSWVISKEIKPPGENTHCVERHLAVAKYLGCQTDAVNYNLSVPDADRDKVKALLSSTAYSNDKKLVLIHPGGGWVSRRWFPERYAELAQKLISELSCYVVLIGGKEGGSGEIGLSEEIRSYCKEEVIDLTGKLSLRELMALFSLSNLVIGNEAGPMHIATAMNVPAIAILGPTDPKRTGPFGGKTMVIQHQPACGPCRNRNCKNKECMRLIKVEDVFSAAGKILA